MSEELEIKITADASGVEGGVQDAQSSLGGLESDVGEKSSSMMDSFGKIGASIASAFSAEKIVGFLNEMVNLQGVQQASEFMFETYATKMGGWTADEIAQYKAFASEVQSNSVFGDEAIMQATKYFTALGLGYDETTALTQVSADLATIMGTDISSASETLTRAINTGNIASLQKLGLVTEKQAKQFKNLRTEEQRVKWIQENLGVTIEGTAEAYSHTLQGAITQAQNAFGDCGEVMGSVFAPALTFVAECAEKVASFLTEHPAILQAVAVVLGIAAVAMAGYAAYTTIAALAQASLLAPILIVVGAITALIAVIALVITYWDQIKAAAITAWEATVAVVSSAIDSIISFFAGLGPVLAGAWDGMKEMASTAWDAIIEGVSNAIEGIKSFFSGLGETLSSIWDGIKSTASGVWDAISGFVSGAVDGIKGFFNDMGETISTKWEEIKTGASEKWEDIKTSVSEKATEIKDSIDEGISNAVSICSDTWESIKTGASDSWDTIKTTLGDKATAVKDAIDEGIEGATSFLSGIWDGIKTTATDTWDTISSSIDSVMSTIGDPIQSAFEAIQGFIEDPLGSAQEFVQSAIDTISGIFTGADFSLPAIKLPHITATGGFSLNPLSWPTFEISWYAKGGVFDEPTLFNFGDHIGGLGEHGAEAIVPLENNTEWLDKIAQRLNQGSDKQIILNVDGKTFAKTSIDSINTLTRQTGNLGLILG